MAPAAAAAEEEKADEGVWTAVDRARLAGIDEEPGLYAISANLLQAWASRFKGPWSSTYEHAYQQLLRNGLLSRREAAGLRFARLCAHLRRLEPAASIGHTILVWRLSADDLLAALLGAPAELLPTSALSPGMRAHQARAVRALLGEVLEGAAPSGALLR